MTPENQLQTSVWLGDLYSDFLIKTSEARKIDTAILRQLAMKGKYKMPTMPLDNKLVMVENMKE